MRSCLAGGNTLSRSLSARPLEKGRVLTYLPSDVETARAAKFEWGGLFQGGAEEITSKWYALISAHLRRADRQYCIIEDIAAPGDACLSSPSEQFFAFRSEVYDFLSLPPQSVADARQFLSKARQYPSICALTKIPDAPPFSPRQEVPIETIHLLARNTSHIMVGAYDEESYILWTEN